MPSSDLGKQYILRAVRLGLEELFERLHSHTRGMEQNHTQFLEDIERQLEQTLEEIEERRSLEIRR